ncbi:uncharacterized protein STEHIDRAFT_151326 [Stereum hirsutum FP-91666 SS1]|uniref:uncharacterized protein n=1 Tax=Stereum hirsutum (strain FP-91666) TaxID=721885 RepID=UPI000440CE27|nr:uncharacterized protein STEHIDRAFT_151326 [Stereum hirsutum FP-91666 SS1]EIM91971.1 hypothetical protein STEHIDRAFT_151326 [Stereum hirsutum FP-91666 SS1]
MHRPAGTGTERRAVNVACSEFSRTRQHALVACPPLSLLAYRAPLLSPHRASLSPLPSLLLPLSLPLSRSPSKPERERDLVLKRKSKFYFRFFLIAPADAFLSALLSRAPSPSKSERDPIPKYPHSLPQAHILRTALLDLFRVYNRPCELDTSCPRAQSVVAPSTCALNLHSAQPGPLVLLGSVRILHLHMAQPSTSIIVSSSMTPARLSFLPAAHWWLGAQNLVEQNSAHPTKSSTERKRLRERLALLRGWLDLRVFVYWKRQDKSGYSVPCIPGEEYELVKQCALVLHEPRIGQGMFKLWLPPTDSPFSEPAPDPPVPAHLRYPSRPSAMCIGRIPSTTEVSYLGYCDWSQLRSLSTKMDIGGRTNTPSLPSHLTDMPLGLSTFLFAILFSVSNSSIIDTLRPELYQEISRTCFRLCHEVRDLLPLVLTLRNHLNQVVNDEDLPRGLLTRTLAAVGHLERGVLGWKDFLFTVRTVSRCGLELHAFLSWACDVRVYPNTGTPGQENVRGAIFEDGDFDIFLTFAKASNPVYLRLEERPVPPGHWRCFGPSDSRSVKSGPVEYGQGDRQSMEAFYYPPPGSEGLTFEREARGAQEAFGRYQYRALAGQFSTQLFPFLNTDRPSWFPAPHPVFERAWERVYSQSLKPNTDVVRTFAPPFEILLNGDEETLALRRLAYTYLYPTLCARRTLALRDLAVCPLSKHEWRQVTTGATVAHKKNAGGTVAPTMIRFFFSHAM